MAEIHESLSEFVPLVERAIRNNGTGRIKLIAPGWGSSGYYSKPVLERDIPRYYPAGTHMFWNHATTTEEMERPEGDLDKLAAVIISTPVWEQNGPKGPGMYADILPRSSYARDIDELAENIGVSIRGEGRVTHGEAEGKQGRIIEEITKGKSVDFVTRPGAGGAIVSLFEAAGRGDDAPAESNPSDETETDPVSESEQENNSMSEEQLQEAQGRITQLEEQLRQSNAAVARLNESLILRDARDLVDARLSETELPELTRRRLRTSLVGNPPVTEAGTLDEARLGEAVTAAIEEAKAELAAILEANTGRITGMGESNRNNTPNREAVTANLNEALRTLGLSEAEAQHAVNGRAF